MPPRVRLDTDGSVVTVRLDHPPMNAFDTAQREELAAQVRRLADSREVRAVVLYGGERLFAAGADVKALAVMDPEDVRGWNRALQRTFDEVARLPMPVVAAITGYALGGGLELALAADVETGTAAGVKVPTTDKQPTISNAEVDRMMKE
ncbi:enoyl-CoA hydratase/isomerase family protein, partial [Streptomyces sp. NPDC052127]|uniref:enoyl-CoA hydratase/isomerase family protein n=1 Tax=Streptomyces sp. NPDC052127 TaxID=3155679 RepID=UPI003430D6B7